MRALLDDLALIKHDDPVRLGNRRKAVCDGDDRAPLPGAGKRLFDLALRLGIKRRGRLIQKKDRRVLEKRARNTNALLLAPRKL